MEIDSLYTEINKRIKFLGLELRNNSQYEHIKKIHIAFEQYSYDYKKAIDILKRRDLNIKGFSKKTNISRQTFYNNPLLQEYFKSLLLELPESPFDKIEKQTHKIDEQNRFMETYIKRDAENSINLAKLKEYEEVIKFLKLENETLRKNNKTLNNIIKQLNR